MDVKGRETLADFVRKVRNEKNLSLSEVERRSGRQISGGYISLLENGHYRNVTSKKLQALAHGLGVPEEELFAVARGRELTVPDARQIQLLTLFQQMPDESQEDFLAIGRALVRRHSVKPVEHIKVEKRRKAA